MHTCKMISDVHKVSLKVKSVSVTKRSIVRCCERLGDLIPRSVRTEWLFGCRWKWNKKPGVFSLRSYETATHSFKHTLSTSKSCGACIFSCKWPCSWVLTRGGLCERCSTLKYRWFLPPNCRPSLQSAHWQERAQGCDYGDYIAHS